MISGLLHKPGDSELTNIIDNGVHAVQIGSNMKPSGLSLLRKTLSSTGTAVLRHGRRSRQISQSAFSNPPKDGGPRGTRIMKSIGEFKEVNYVNSRNKFSSVFVSQPGWSGAWSRIYVQRKPYFIKPALYCIYTRY